MFQYLCLTLLLIGSIQARIRCPKFDGWGEWTSQVCPQSSYCLFTVAQTGGIGIGSTERTNTIDCGSPDNEVWTNTKTIEASRVSESAKALFPVENAVFCDQGHGRWCRVTLGLCHNSISCKIIECRCNIDDCFGFMKTGGVEGLYRDSEPDLLSELDSSPNKTTEGGCNGATKLGGSLGFFLVLLKVVFL